MTGQDCIVEETLRGRAVAGDRGGGKDGLVEFSGEGPLFLSCIAHCLTEGHVLEGIAEYAIG